MEGLRGRSFLLIAVVLGLLPLVAFHIAPADDPGTAAPSARHAELLRRTMAESLWPTDAGRVVTSTFGEFRSSHFHAGIDINTDVTGYRVFAARDGYVSRISVSPNGYGKLLVVTHADGYSTLYAHLSAFAGRIEQIARHAQDSLEHYPVRIECTPGQFPVARGEVIAYTGDTGVGTPHLHFEIHDEDGDPVNPLHCQDFRTTDELPPAISRIAVIPIGEGSTVNGTISPVMLPASTQRHPVDQLVFVEGCAGLAVEARDACEGTRFRRSTYRHTLFVDDQEYFSTSLDRLDGRYLQLVGYHYDWPLWNDRAGRFERLFVPDSFFLPSVRNAGPANGVIDTVHLSPGTHRYRVVTEDFSGNRAEFQGFLHLSPPLRPGGSTVAEGSRVAGSSRIALEHQYDGGYLNVVVTGRLAAAPVTFLYEGGHRRDVAMANERPGRWAGRIRPSGDQIGVRRLVATGIADGMAVQANGELALYPILPGMSGRYEFDGGALVVEYDSLSVFTPVFMQVGRNTDGGAPWYTLGPATAILRDGIAVTLRSPGATATSGLFIRRRGGWSLTGRPAENGFVRGTIHRQLGEITVLDDATPPSISGLSVSTPRRGQPLVTFRYSDDLSGIDYDELKVYLDGRAVIPEVDGEHRRVRYQSASLAYGTHHVSIRLKDRLGNLRTQDHRFVLR